jgi:4-hydroxy-3-polyprenylbenzoate decarboxylase
MSRHFVVGITGASGAIYGLRLCRALLDAGSRLTLLITGAGEQVLREECSLEWRGETAELLSRVRECFGADGRLMLYALDDFRAPVASGSNAPDGVVICPCSMGTLARIASGNSGNLLERCADVALKENRTLLVVPRETPLNRIHLENMLKLSQCGALVVPPVPAFYHHPRTLDDMIDFTVGKVLSLLGFRHNLFTPWGSIREEEREPE